MITDIEGILVGHCSDQEAKTGCTVFLCDPPMVGGVDVRGSAPGTRETDLLRPMNLVKEVNGIVLAGGSAFGLDAVSGVMRYLEEKNQGWDAKVARIPIVPAAVLFDLDIGSSKHRPDAKMGYEACKNAVSGSVERGNVGAGTGATVGKIFGSRYATKSGLGTYSIHTQRGVIISALVVVNAFGDVFDPDTGRIIAGARNPNGEGFANTLEQMKTAKEIFSFAGTNTTIGVIATNAQLNKEEANKVAQMAHDGLARVIRPVHTMFDGDTLFALGKSKSDVKADVTLVGSLAVEAVVRAVLDGIQQSRKP